MFFSCFQCFFYLTDSETEFRRTLKELWKTLGSPLKNSILLFCTIAHIKEVCAVHNTVSSPESLLLRKTVDFSLSVSGCPSPHPLFEVTCIKLVSEDTNLWVVIGEEHRPRLSGSTTLESPAFHGLFFPSYLGFARLTWSSAEGTDSLAMSWQGTPSPGCLGTYFMVMAGVCGSVAGYWSFSSLLHWTAQSKLKQLLL